ncbi:iron ABC transporter permease [Macrococcus hajekii]|uniref:Iron ABC transporter permease n=2 Tax=Macrococcus hajekii TaxID=198482 RepID=A0A4R6BI14_9STAP|nr:iron ABC transporter permease [Macrococcus hajekii]TDM01183.1 iron ABC transporter permease [Macrococcus hajekii]GGB11881.1 enterobactin ABC transporter permease [Macrococcus hajekii]
MIKLLIILSIVTFCHLFFVKGHLWPADAFDWMIIRDIRLPRTLLGLLAGFILAVTGLVFQTVFGNKLADSFTLGLAGSASLGSALGIILGISVVMVSIMMSLLALLFIIYLTHTYFRRSQRIGMILFGLFINFFCSSALYGLVVLWPGRSRQLMNYLFGSIGTATWTDIGLLMPLTLVGTAGLFWLARAITIVASGETLARGVGINDQIIIYISLSIASVMTAVLISTTGIIGFVGLIIPQLFSGMKQFWSVGITGSIAVMSADFLGNNLLAPIQLPVSVPLSLAGLPLLLLMMLKKEARGGLK